jgi:S-(hydroxymethyl)glutathione dehydrogenase/alcohol dehydrogenase
MPDGTSRFSLDGKKLHHYMGTSTFANFTVLPEIAVAKIREDAPFDKVCYIGCGVTTGIGAVLNTAKVEPGAKCVVFGLGGIGLNVIQGLRLAGASEIIAIDVVPEKLEMAKRFGATRTINGKTGDPVVQVQEATGGLGVEYSFEAIGSPDAAAQAFKMIRNGGTAVIVGMMPLGSEIKLSGPDFLMEKKVIGCMYGSTRFREHMPKLIELFLKGRLDLSSLVSQRLPLSDVNHAFELMKGGKVARSVLEIGHA